MGGLAQRFERFMDFVVKGVPVSMNILLLNWVNWFREYKILRNCFLSFHLVYFLFHWRGIKDSSLFCTAFTGNNPWVRTIFSFFSRWIVRHVKNGRVQLCIESCIEFIFYLFGILSLCIFLIKLPLISSHLVGITCPYLPRCFSLKFWKFFPGSLLAKNFWISSFGGIASHWSNLRVIPPNTPVTTPFQNQSGICSSAWCDKHYS